MPEVRDILLDGADVNPGLPDVPELMRRARSAQRRRAGVVAGVAAAAVVTAVAMAEAVLPLREDTAPEPAAPTPATSLPSVAGSLPADTYDASSAGLDLRFTVPGPGWTLAAVDDGWVTLRHGRSTVAIQQWDDVVDPAADPVGPGDTVPAPADLVSWLTSNPRLDVAGIDQVPVDEQTWTGIDVTVEQPLATTPTECNTLPCVLLGMTGDEPFELLARDRARLLVPPDPGSAGDPDLPNLVLVHTGPRTRDSADAATEQLLTSLELR